MDLERMFMNYGAAMLRHAQLLLGRDAMAEDAVQEALLKIMRTSAAPKDDAHEKAWLLAVTGNICRDFLRRRNRRREVAIPEWFDAPSSEPAPEEEITRTDRDARLAQAVMNLPVKYREPVLLVYYHELSSKEAARVMGLTGTAFRSRLMRARDMLRDALGEEILL